MSWWPWQSGKSRNRVQREESLSRLVETSSQMIEAAGADNRQASEEARAAVERRAVTSAPLRPILKTLIERLSEPSKDCR